MSMSEATTPQRAPVHLWIVGIVSVLWGGMGAVDYVMTQLHNEAYMSQFTPVQLEFYYGFPAWLVAAWAIAVWGGVLGAVLLLLRRGLAAPVFLVSLVMMVVTTIRNYGFANGLEIMGGGFSLVFTGVIFVVSVAQWMYARAMRQRGVLR